MRKYQDMRIDELHGYENNARTHSPEQVDKIVKSIEEFGFINPVLVDENNMIMAGHGRVLAAKQMGMSTVPCLFIEDLTDEQKRAYIIADNKLAEEAGWDEELLALELQELQNIGFNIELTGFTIEDLEGMTKEEAVDVEEDNFEPELPDEPKSKLGEVYKLGRHYLMCGDSTKEADIKKLMNGVQADMLLTDPPYNVNYEGSTGLKIMNDKMDNDNFRLFLRDAFSAANQVLKDGGAFYIWHADIEGYNFRGACVDIGWKVRQCLIWNKNSLVLGRQDYQCKHEPCLYGWKEGAGHYFIDDRSNTTVFEDDLDIDSVKKEDMKKLLHEIFDTKIPTTVINCEKPKKNGEHPTMKPLKLLAQLVINSTKPKQVVLDSFGGSGSTLMTCEQLGRTCYTMELDPKYVDVIINRYEEMTGNKAVKIN